MEIEKTPLWKDAQNIIINGEDNTKVGWTAIIHLNNEEDEKYTPLHVTAVNIRRDYNLAYADELTCTVLMPMGKYARRVYPNRKNLEITLTKNPIKDFTRIKDEDREPDSEKYSATLIDDGRALIEAQGQESNDEFALDLMGVVDIHFQLYTKSVEQIRMMTVGGSFRQTTIKEVILGVLTNESKKAKVDKKQALVGVDLIPISNKEKKEHVVITHGIKLFDLPNYLQNKYGVYSTGLGSYIQNRIWYVFPMYDTTQFEKREKNMTLLILPTSKCPELHKSFKKKGDALTVLISGDTGFRDDSGTQYLNDGNGVRLGDANKYLGKYNTTKDNKTKVERIKNNSEFITDERDSELNIMNVTGARITANPFVVYSNLIGRKGGIYKCTWENSDPSLIFPGMLVKIVYFDKEEVKELYGVMLGTNSSSYKIGDMNSLRHTTNTLMYIFVNQKVEK